MSTIQPMPSVEARIAALEWPAIEAALWHDGFATLTGLLTGEECTTMQALFQEDQHFRSRIDMGRYHLGEGYYKYFTYPLPPLVHTLRTSLYPHLATIANAWEEACERRPSYPGHLDHLLALCRRYGQTKPTPLLLQYTAGGYNRLHQDIYGEVTFPIQLTVFLTQAGRDFTGGEFLLLEQRPRTQSRGHVLTPDQGDALLFTTRTRPVRGTRGYYQVAMRHGVSTIRSGSRMTLGVIFHDAR